MRFSAICFALLLVTCGGQTSSVPLDPKKQVVELTSDELKELCDQLAALFGGYGGYVACAPYFSGPSDQASCVLEYMQSSAKYPNCPLTVDQALTCPKAAGQDACLVSPPPPPTGCTGAMTISGLCMP